LKKIKKSDEEKREESDEDGEWKIAIEEEEMEDEWNEYLDHLKASAHIPHIVEFSSSGCVGDLVLSEGEKTLMLSSLKQNTNIVSLNLDNGFLCDSDVETIAEILKYHSNLTKLSLFQNNISDKGVKSIVNVLEDCKKLTHLDLSFNNIEADGMTELLAKVATNTSLRVLDVSENEISFDAISDLLQQNKTLVSLDLGGPGFFDTKFEGVKELEENTTLTHLSISHFYSNADTWSLFGDIVRKNTTLTSLNLNDNNISDIYIEYIARALEENTTLTCLNLGGNNLGKWSGVMLGHALRTNTTLVNLNLFTSNVWGSFVDKPLADGIKTNTTLLYLTLSCTERFGPFYSFSDPPEEALRKERVVRDIIENNTSLIALHLECICQEEAFLKILEKNTSLLELRVQWDRHDGGNDLIDKKKEGVERIMARNLRFWNRRVRWSCVVLYLTRVLLMRRESVLPNEILHEIIYFVVPKGILNEKVLQRVIEVGCDERTLGKDKMEFIVSVLFGEKNERRGREIGELIAYDRFI